MANRYFPSQFSFSFEKRPVRLMGSFEQTDIGAAASVVTQGITITANRIGSAGNDITITFTAGGTAGAEVVTVSGNEISVEIESTVSTVTQVRTAINASVDAAALVTASGTSASTVAAATAVSLTGGDDSDYTESSPLAGMVLSQSATGVYEIELPNSYTALIGASIMIQKASAADLQPQLISSDVTDDKIVSFRLLAGSTPTNLANGDILFITLELRN